MGLRISPACTVQSPAPITATRPARPAGWKSAKELIIVPQGALAELRFHRFARTVYPFQLANFENIAVVFIEHAVSIEENCWSLHFMALKHKAGRILAKIAATLVEILRGCWWFKDHV